MRSLRKAARNVTVRQDRETMESAAPDNVDCTSSCGGDRRRHFGSLISGVGEHALDEGKAAACLASIAMLRINLARALARRPSRRLLSLTRQFTTQQG